MSRGFSNTPVQVTVTVERAGPKVAARKGRSSVQSVMAYYDFRKYVLQERSDGLITCTTQYETAQLFGWDKAFAEYSLPTHIGPDGNTHFYIHPAGKYRNLHSGGHRLRICRSKRTTGYAAGLTHCFRMKGGFSRKHLKMLAEVAGEKFEWMETKERKRVSRDVWLK